MTPVRARLAFFGLAAVFVGVLVNAHFLQAIDNRPARRIASNAFVGATETPAREAASKKANQTTGLTRSDRVATKTSDLSPKRLHSP